MTFTDYIIAKTAPFVLSLFNNWEICIENLVADDVLCMHLAMTDDYCQQCTEWKTFVSNSGFRKIEPATETEDLDEIFAK